MQTLKTTTIVSAAFLSLLLSACGGGGSSPLDPRPNSSSSSSAGQLSSGAASSVDTVTAQKLGAGTGASFREGEIDVTNDLTNLSAGGTTTLSVYVVTSTNTPAATPIQISFISDCVAAAKATLRNGANETVSSVTTINGRATINYRADGCSGTDTIYASANIDGNVKNAQVSLNIAQGNVGSIQFSDATPKQISLKGSGGTETSTVRFRVLDENGAALSKAQVTFDIASKPGDLTFAPNSAESDSEGYVTTRVTAGNVATPVSISATIIGTNISTSSSELTISSGIPVQHAVSLSASKLNPLAWTTDGTEVTLTMMMADDFGNPVIDGTAVSFWAESGTATATCLTKDSECSVIWKSSGERPLNGLVSILAFASGNETFTDISSNGRYDKYKDPTTETFKKEPVKTLGEAYLDANENGQYDLGEKFVDVGLPGHTSETWDNGTMSEIYNGTLCYTAEATEGICTKDKVTVRSSIILSMSSSSGNLSLWNDENCSSSFEGKIAGNRGLIYLLATDINGNSLPNGTKLTSSNPVGISIALDTTVPNSPYAACIPISVAANPSTSTSATFSIKAETSSTESFSYNFGISFLQ